MGGLGTPELIIIVVVLLLLFGSTQLPKLARSVGQASKEFKKGVQEGGNDVKEAAKEFKSDDKAEKAEPSESAAKDTA